MPSAAAVKQAYAARAGAKMHDRRRLMNQRQARARGVLRRGMRRRTFRKLRRSFVNKQNVEVKSIEHVPQTYTLTRNDGSATNGPSNSLVIISGLHGGDIQNFNIPNPGIQRGTGCDQLLGCYVKEAYPHSLKYELDFSQFFSDPDGTTGVITTPTVEVIHGQIKNTAAKMGIPTTPDIPGGAQGPSSTQWLVDLYAVVKKELYDSQFDADHLTWQMKNRRVKILKRYTVKPRQSSLQASATAAAPILTVPPKYEGGYKFPITNRKTKLHECGTLSQAQGVGPFWVPAELWVPFTLIMCPNISQGKSLTCRFASKCYITDN